MLTSTLQPWRHFWLPCKPPSERGKNDLKLFDAFNIAGSDSEDDSPRRDRLTLGRRRLQDDITANSDSESLSTSLSYLTLQHRLVEKNLPEAAPHSCQYCRRIAIDLRRYHADSILQADKQHPKGWQTSAKIGFTMEQATRAAAKGCKLFSFIIDGSGDQVANRTRPRQSSAEITVVADMRGTAGAGFSIEHRFDKTMTLNIYTVPGNVL